MILVIGEKDEAGGLRLEAGRKEAGDWGLEAGREIVKVHHRLL